MWKFVLNSNLNSSFLVHLLIRFFVSNAIPLLLLFFFLKIAFVLTGRGFRYMIQKTWKGFAVIFGISISFLESTNAFWLILSDNKQKKKRIHTEKRWTIQKKTNRVDEFEMGVFFGIHLDFSWIEPSDRKHISLHSQFVTLSPEVIILTCAFTTQSWVSFSVPCCCCSTFCQRCDCFVFVLAVWFEFDALLIWTWLVFCLVFVFVFGLDPCWVVKKWGIIRELDQILSTLFFET